MRFVMLLFLTGIISAFAGVYIVEIATPFTAMGEVLVPLIIWSASVFLILLYKDPKASAISLPILLLILFVNFYPLLAGHPLFSGTPLVYLTVFFSPIGLPVLPLVLLLLSFFGNKNTKLALRAISISFIALAIVIFSLFVLPVMQASPEPMEAYIVNRGGSPYDVRITVTDCGKEIFNRSYLVKGGESVYSDPITSEPGTYYVTVEVNGEEITKKAEVQECRCKTKIWIEVKETGEGIVLSVESLLEMWD